MIRGRGLLGPWYNNGLGPWNFNVESDCSLLSPSCWNDGKVQCSPEAGPVSCSCHPYAEGLDKTLVSCPPNSKREESEQGPAPLEALLHQTAAPIPMQGQIKGALPKPGMRKEANILLPAPESLERGQTAPWTWPWELKASHMCWVALIAPWGQGVERNL